PTSPRRYQPDISSENSCGSPAGAGQPPGISAAPAAGTIAIDPSAQHAPVRMVLMRVMARPSDQPRLIKGGSIIGCTGVGASSIQRTPNFRSCEVMSLN